MDVRSLMAGAAALGFISGQAAAQTVGSNATPPQPPAATASAQSSSSSGGVNTGEVVIVAQRREERLVNVPIAVTTLNAQQLQRAGVNDLNDLTQLTPGVSINKIGAYIQPTIRGVGTQVTGGDANVALYVDGVYRAEQAGNIFDFNNISNVEVLKGPQGTLFGRNATGGAILVTTADPQFQPSGHIGLSYGSYNDVQGTFYATGGLTDTIAANIAVYARHFDGFIHNIINGQPSDEAYSYAVRSKILWNASPTLKFVFSAEYSDTNDPSTFSYTVVNGNTLAKALSPTTPIPTQIGQTEWSAPPRAEPQATNLSLRAIDDLGWATLTSTTGYENVPVHITADVGASVLELILAQYREEHATISQEFNLASKGGGPFTWVAGLFYLNDNSQSLDFKINGAPLNNNNRTVTNAYAAYVDGTYQIGQLFLTAGLRYGYESKSLAQEGVANNLNANWSAPTPRFVVRYQLSRDQNVYASYSRGFKSGLFNAGQATPVNPETIDAYEVGYKIAHPRWQFEASAYYYNYSNIQVIVFNPSPGGLTQLQNAARARIYGADAQLTAELTDNLQVDVNFAYTNAKYTSFPNAIIYVGDGAGNIQTVANESGRWLFRSPEFTGTLQFLYRHPLPVGRLELSSSIYGSSTVYFSTNNTLFQKPYALIEAKASWISPNDRWDLSLWGHNLSDTHYFNQISQNAVADLGIYGEPISGGVSMDYRF